jgi:hypothetical protein
MSYYTVVLHLHMIKKFNYRLGCQACGILNGTRAYRQNILFILANAISMHCHWMGKFSLVQVHVIGNDLKQIYVRILKAHSHSHSMSGSLI